MSRSIVLGTISFEEVPAHLEHHAHPALHPSAIEEDEDLDARSLVYLLEDNDFERAAVFLAAEEARRRANALAQAEAEAEARRQQAQQQRARALAQQLEQLLDDDEQLIDLLGRRILAINGHHVQDLWHPHQHDRYAHLGGPSHASSSHALPRAGFVGRRDLHAVWGDNDASAGPTGASPFIHASPLVVLGNAPYRRTIADRTAGPSGAKLGSRVAIHPLTGVRMLLQDDQFVELPDAGDESDAESEEWAVRDESDIDWLGRELLRRRLGADVWVIGTDDRSPPPVSPTQAKDERKQETVAAVPVSVEEVESDDELVTAAQEMATASPGPRHRDTGASPAQAETRSSDDSPANTSGKTRQRAATVMSESEEEELETVGRIVTEPAASLNDRPRKAVKVVDRR
ncbi:hypothetical protein PANT_14d00011 [Moesziomyces antarcticus T-34]|uniref:Uncharacterized protein n=1 Tax=Pseudozyma antarctica (strain T-34) TaxID=1151754 RepID=M9LX25_PSEA3|nr:hypothetical protein PANT_14d00011 [Moesziomyces antarcticus T-34]